MSLSVTGNYWLIYPLSAVGEWPSWTHISHVLTQNMQKEQEKNQKCCCCRASRPALAAYCWLQRIADALKKRTHTNYTYCIYHIGIYYTYIYHRSPFRWRRTQISSDRLLLHSSCNGFAFACGFHDLLLHCRYANALFVVIIAVVLFKGYRYLISGRICARDLCCCRVVVP